MPIAASPAFPIPRTYADLRRAVVAAFLAGQRAAERATIHATKPDKYDRYLADVFIATGRGADVFLNNALLEQGLAERKDAWEFGDWEKLALW